LLKAKTKAEKLGLFDLHGVPTVVTPWTLPIKTPKEKVLVLYWSGRFCPIKPSSIYDMGFQEARASDERSFR